MTAKASKVPSERVTERLSAASASFVAADTRIAIPSNNPIVIDLRIIAPPFGGFLILKKPFSLSAAAYFGSAACLYFLEREISEKTVMPA
jgi:hypothetical protein